MKRRIITFDLIRDADVSGVSGTGRVAEGMVFSDGEAVIHWLGTYPTTTAHPKGITSIRYIHGHSGATRIVINDPVQRLERIAAAHSKEILAGGLTSGLCVECGHRWPCPSWTWASTDRDPLSTWECPDGQS